MKKLCGKKDAARLGWVKVELPKEIYDQLHEFGSSIPSEWTCDSQGRTRAEGGKEEQHFHVTFLLQLKDAPGKVEALRAILSQEEPIELGFGEMSYNRVARITRREVHCLGLPILDDRHNRLFNLRERCATAIGGKVQPHLFIYFFLISADSVGQVAYSGPGHISLAYIVGQHARDGEALASKYSGLMCGQQFLITSVVVEWGPRDSATKERAEVHFKGCGPGTEERTTTTKARQEV
jgi:hypothetical protein